MLLDRRPIVCCGASYYLALILLALCATTSLAQNIPKLSDTTLPPWKLSDILPANARSYDKLQPPKVNDKPSVVTVHVTVSSLDSLDETSMSYSADVFLAQLWTDDRLRAPPNMTTPYRHINVDWMENLWIPDLYFMNAKDSTVQMVPTTNQYIWYYSKSKTLLYMMKVYVTLSCNMNFAAYPHDTQICKLQMESLSYTTNDLVFKWDDAKPLVVDENIVLPEFQLSDTSMTECAHKLSAGTFSCLEVHFIFTRNLGYFIFHTYIPLYIIVILSWLSFWADPQASLARLSLGGICLFAAAALLARCHAGAPLVIQLTAIEVFASICTLFTFLALMEYFLVMVFMGDSYHKNSSMVSSDPSVKVDMISRIVFPSLFVAFNVIYWIVIAVL